MENQNLEQTIESKRADLKKRIIEILGDPNISSGTRIDKVEKEIEKSKIEIRRLL